MLASLIRRIEDYLVYSSLNHDPVSFWILQKIAVVLARTDEALLRLPIIGHGGFLSTKKK